MEIARQVSAVILVFALLGAALWALRRGGRLRFGERLRMPGGRRVRALESLERLALTPQHSLHLVKIAGREVVVATSPQGCVLLTERAQGAEN
jgi:flagellar biogenesis protein FliO